MTPWSEIALLAFDIDGTLTDGTTWWGGDGVGWVQRYSVRDGEAILRLKQRLHVVPVSKNPTAAAAERVARLGLDGRWLGTADKLESMRQICREYNVAARRVLFVGDGPDDVPVFALVGIGCAVADAHPVAARAAHFVLQSRGGDRVIEEIEGRLESEA
jgi:3-deoxy-D-manno-octulosonate 8-phosphate phosphatase (KDO 8-P phosphatase)